MENGRKSAISRGPFPLLFDSRVGAAFGSFAVLSPFGLLPEKRVFDTDSFCRPKRKALENSFPRMSDEKADSSLKDQRLVI